MRCSPASPAAVPGTEWAVDSRLDSGVAQHDGLHGCAPCAAARRPNPPTDVQEAFTNFFGRQFVILDAHGNLTGRNLELEGHIFGTDDGDRYADDAPVRSVGAWARAATRACRARWGVGHARTGWLRHSRWVWSTNCVRGVSPACV